MARAYTPAFWAVNGAGEDARGPKGEGAGGDARDKEWNAARMAALVPAGMLAVRGVGRGGRGRPRSGQ
jgi:hypothetical protein